MTRPYGKIYPTMYTGSMAGSGFLKLSLWPWILANKGADGIISLNPKLLPPIFGEGEPAQFAKAIEDWCNPDGDSRESDDDWLEGAPEEIRELALAGMRLAKLGKYEYYVVKHEYYKRLGQAEDRKEYKANWIKIKRAKVGASLSTGVYKSLLSTSVGHVDTLKESKVKESKVLTNPIIPSLNSQILDQIIEATQGVLYINRIECMEALESLKPPLNVLELDPVLEWINKQVPKWSIREQNYRPHLKKILRTRAWEDKQPEESEYPLPGQDPKRRQCSCGLPADFVSGNYETPYCRWCGPKGWEEKFPGIDPGPRPRSENDKV